MGGSLQPEAIIGSLYDDSDPFDAIPGVAYSGGNMILLVYQAERGDKMGLFDSFKAKQEEQRQKNPDNLPTQGQLTIRLLVGGYLYYLIYQIYTGGGLENRGWKLVIIVVAMLLFAGFGAYFLYNGIRAMMGHEYFDPNAVPPEPEQAEPEEESSESEEEQEE